jgi:DHA2 family methylenomycin A resistance protein-like MFS transporter
MLYGQALAALGYLALVFVHADSSALAIALPLLAVGSGVALAVPSINTAVLTHVGPSRIGIASGVLNSARQIGGVMGVGVFGSLIRPESNDMIAGLHIAVTVAFAATLLSLVIGRTRLEQHQSAITECAG